MMRRQRFHRETLELAPFARRREALFVAERELDKSWVAQCRIDLGVGRIKQLRDPPGRYGEDVLQVQQRLDRAGSKRTAERAQVLEIDFERLARAPSERIQHDSAAERAQIGLVAHDEAVAGKRDDRVSEYDLDECAPLGRDLARLFEHDHAADRLGSADKEADALVALQCALCGGANFEPRVEPHRRDFEPLVGKHVAAFEFEPFAAGQVERDALAEARALDRLAMHLYRTNAHLLAGWQHAQLLPGPDDCAHRSTRHYRAMALDYERAIDRQPKEAGGTARLEAVELARNLCAQLIEAHPGHRRDRDYRRASSPVASASNSISSRTSVRRFSSARSAFVIRKMPRLTPSRCRMSRCSSLCGITPSSAATVNSTRSIPCAPASMLRMNRSWPGTSITPARVPSPSVKYANPRSIEMPRSFSSLRRSVSCPVSALISAVLPWSI